MEGSAGSRKQTIKLQRMQYMLLHQSTVVLVRCLRLIQVRRTRVKKTTNIQVQEEVVLSTGFVEREKHLEKVMTIVNTRR